MNSEDGGSHLFNCINKTEKEGEEKAADDGGRDRLVKCHLGTYTRYSAFALVSSEHLNRKICII